PQRVLPAGCVVAPSVLVVALLAAAIEEVTEQLIELWIVGQVRHRADGALVARRYVLRRRDVDNRVDHPFCDVGDAFGSARFGRCRKRWQDQDGQCNGGQGGPADFSGIPDEWAEHGGLCSSREVDPGQCACPGMDARVHPTGTKWA